VRVTGGTEALILAGNRIFVEGPRYLGSFGGTLNSMISVIGDECEVHKGRVNADNAGMIVTAAYKNSGDLNYMQGMAKALVGTITATTDLTGSTNADGSIRG